MQQKEKFQTICKLFNSGILTLKDAVKFGLNNYVLTCQSGKVISMSKEVEK